MTAFVAIAAAVALVFGIIAVRPLLAGGARALFATAVASVAVISVASYFAASNYDDSLPTSAPSGEAIAAELRSRAESRPDEPAGWRTLGRWHMENGSFADAVEAFDKANSAAGRADADIMLDYAEALAAASPESIEGIAAELIENALVIAPGNARALWYGGSVAAARGDRDLAARRWEAMLRPDMPPEVRDLLETRIAAMRGAPAVPATSSEPIITVDVELDASLQDRLGPESVLYLIANRDGGGPPVAVARHQPASLPGQFTLSDSDVMLAGERLSDKSAITLTARVSLSGGARAMPGDLQGLAIVELPQEAPQSVLIDSVVD